MSGSDPFEPAGAEPGSAHGATVGPWSSIEMRELSGSRFENVDLSGSSFRNVNLAGTRVHGAYLSGLVITDSFVDDVRIEGHLGSLRVNGVDVSSFVEEELDRRHPDRRGLRADDVAGLRQAWTDAGQRTDAVVARARRLPPGLVDEQVNGEFSFVETLRHLVFVFDRWLTGPVFGDRAPYFHPLGVSHESGAEGPADGLDPAARPTLDEVLAVRQAQFARITDWLGEATDPDLDRSVASPDGGSATVLECVRVVLTEEWWHHQYATRDLGALEQRTA